MTTTTQAIATETTSIAVSPVIKLSGKGKGAREIAFMQTAALSYFDQEGRAALIANLRVALGTSPEPVALATAQREVTIGRVAARLAQSEFPKDCTTDDAKLDYARQLVMHYQQPAEPGKTSKLRKGNTGFRSVIQHKAIRAADQAWSQIMAELGIGNAVPGAKRKANALKAKRATNANPVRGQGKGEAPSHSELVTPAKGMTADEAHAHVERVAADLLAFANGKQGASLLCTDYGTLINAFKTGLNKAANDRALRKAAKEAGEHNN